MRAKSSKHPSMFQWDAGDNTSVKLSSKLSKWLFDITGGRHERNAGFIFTCVQKYFGFLTEGDRPPHRSATVHESPKATIRWTSWMSEQNLKATRSNRSLHCKTVCRNFWLFVCNKVELLHFVKQRFPTFLPHAPLSPYFRGVTGAQTRCGRMPSCRQSAITHWTSSVLYTLADFLREGSSLPLRQLSDVSTHPPV